MRWVSEEKLLHLIEDIKTIFARKDEVPKKLSELENDIGAGVGDGGNFEEKDPTVPSWAKNPTKPKYTANEVGALPDTTKIPSKTSDLQNDSGFLTEHQDLSGYALKSEVPKSASDVGADVSGTAESKVSAHNVSDAAHNDIRLLVKGLTDRLNAIADSDDTTLDQMSEIVAYIKSNKSLIDDITTSKVNVSDIIDNLTTNVSNKPLSASQGVALKNLIDAIIIPTTLPNPKSLTFTGAVTGSYDGSEEFTVNIPSGDGGESGNDTGNFEPILTYVASSEDAELTQITFTSSEYPKISEIKNRIIMAIFRETVPTVWNRPYVNGAPIACTNFENKYSYSLIYRIGDYLYGNNVSCANHASYSKLLHSICVTGNKENLVIDNPKVPLPYTSIGIGSYTKGWLHEGDKIVIMGEI